jgi:SnoaL-like domain
VNDEVARLAVALDRHDLDTAASLFHASCRSEQPAHPGRAFVGRTQMRANWGALFAGVPDLHAVALRSVQQTGTTWTEWRWWGTRRDGPSTCAG